ncbi:N-acetylmuramoyl-L-alanine amidase [bacterium]|nr:N-acetylmuramoyl-L-alanine amidase [bacterium]
MKLLFYCFVIFVPQLTAQIPVKLDFGKKSSSIIPVYNGDQNYIAANDIVDLLDAGFYENKAKKKIVLSIPGHQIKVTGNNPFVVVDEKDILQMPVDCQYIDGIIFLPIRFFVPILNAYLTAPVLVDDHKFIMPLSEAGLSKIEAFEDTEKGRVNLTAITFDKKSNGLLIKLKTEKRFRKDDVEVWRNKNWLYVTISDGLSSDDVARDIKLSEQFKLIKSALIFQHKNSVQLSFQLNYDIPGQEIVVDDKSGDVFVSIRVSNSAHLDVDPLKKPNLNIQKDQWKIDKIVLDAGHGGWDNGASGKNKTREKDMTLAIVLKLGKLIEQRLGLKVEYTRDTDTYITLHGRTKFANSRNAKLFVSVHCNSNVKRKANGFETFFLSPSRTDEALAVARKENEVIELEKDNHKYGDFTDEKFILSNIMQSVFVKESEELADYIQKGLDKQLSLTNRGVSQAPFYVLMGASMPAVLVETAFISNVNEEKFLKSEDGQKKLAEGIYDGIKNFIQDYEKSQKK